MSVSAQRATNHAIGHFMRVCKKEDDGLGKYLRTTLKRRMGDRAYRRLGYFDKRLHRDQERHRLQCQLLELLKQMNPCDSDLQYLERDHVLLLRGETDAGVRFFARVDLERRLVIGFYSEATFLRLEAIRRVRDTVSVPAMCR